MPTNFSIAARQLISSAAGTSNTKLTDLPVFSSEPLVEAGLVISPLGAVLPLVDWSRQVGSGTTSLNVTINTNELPELRHFTRASMATGATVFSETDATGRTVFHVPRLAVADAIILRPPISE